MSDRALEDRLAARLVQLIDCVSTSGQERELAGLVRTVLAAAGAHDAGDDCVLAGTTSRGDRPLVVLAGHLDTVPAQGNLPARQEDGVVHGLGAADMKGALAVMIELLLALPARRTIDVGAVFFPREELPFTETSLTPLLEREPGLRTADLAIVMEPTANRIQLGCLGNLNATWTFAGSAGHSARPWLADNAIEHAARAITALAAEEPVEHEFAGLTFTAVTTAVMIAGGIARNVVPDSCVVELNHRYAPGTSATAAEEGLRRRCEQAAGRTAELAFAGNAPSGAVPSGNRLIGALAEAVGDRSGFQPKQAWTPVAEFALAGVDAVNFGPGDPVFAHRRDEQVSTGALAASYEALRRLITG